MKTIMQFYAFLIFFLCSPLILQSAQAKPIRKKPVLKVAIPESYIDGRWMFIQNFKSSSKTPQINFSYILQRGDLPLPSDPSTFDFKYKNPVIIIYSITHTRIPDKSKDVAETIPSFSFPRALE